MNIGIVAMLLNSSRLFNLAYDSKGYSLLIDKIKEFYQSKNWNLEGVDFKSMAKYGSIVTLYSGGQKMFFSELRKYGFKGTIEDSNKIREEWINKSGLIWILDYNEKTLKNETIKMPPLEGFSEGYEVTPTRKEYGRDGTEFKITSWKQPKNTIVALVFGIEQMELHRNVVEFYYSHDIVLMTRHDSYLVHIDYLEDFKKLLTKTREELYNEIFYSDYFKRFLLENIKGSEYEISSPRKYIEGLDHSGAFRY